LKTASIVFILLILVTGTVVGTGTDLEEMLKSEDPEVRSDACLALIEEGPAATGTLAPFLQDDSMLVRHCAAYALARIGDEAAENLFRDGLNSKDYDIRRVSALGLGMMKKKEMAETLGPLLRDRNWEVRWAAAYVLGRSKDRRALALLGPVAEGDLHYDRVQEKYPVREAARRSMEILNGTIGWQTDPDRARALAREEGKPLLIYFRRSGSELCSSFERFVLMEEKIIDVLQRYVCLWLDHLRDPSVFERYGIKKVPSLLFFSPGGNKLGGVEAVILPDRLLEQALAFLEEEKSVARLRSRLEKGEGAVEASWRLAELYLDEGSWSRALENLDRLIENDPYNLSSLLDNALFARAFIRGKQGDYEGSRAGFRELLERFPSFGDRSQSLYCWGLSALKVGETEEGKKALRELSEEYPGTELAAAADRVLDSLAK
jgi:tetratricopeptide (TPR) repeat protein